MTTLAKMAIELTVENRQLRTKLDQTTRAIDSLEKKVASSGSTIAAWGKGLAVAGAAAMAMRTIVRGVSDAMERIDSQGKVAQSFGLKSDEFAALAHAADLSGVSVEDLGGAFRKMSAIVGMAQQGSKQAIATLEKLGLKAKNISRNPAEAMAQFADALAGVGDQYQRTLLQQQIFGKSAAKLAPLFESGGAAIRDAADEASRFRIAITERDRAMIEQANDEWRRMGVILEGLYNQIAIQMSPAIQALAQNVITLNDQWSALGSNQSAILDDGIAKLSMFEEVLAALGTTGEAIVTGVQYIGAWITRLFANIALGFGLLVRDVQSLTGGSFGDVAVGFAEGMIEENNRQFEEIKRRFMDKTFRERMLENKQAAIDTAKKREAAIDKQRAMPFEPARAAGGGGPAAFPSALQGADAFSQAFMNRRSTEQDQKRFQNRVVDRLDDIVHALEFGEVQMAAFDGGGA